MANPTHVFTVADVGRMASLVAAFVDDAMIARAEKLDPEMASAILKAKAFTASAKAGATDIRVIAA